VLIDVILGIDQIIKLRTFGVHIPNEDPSDAIEKFGNGPIVEVRLGLGLEKIEIDLRVANLI
jgi:hypothetical protein